MSTELEISKNVTDPAGAIRADERTLNHSWGELFWVDRAKLEAPRPIGVGSLSGIGDRLRAAAFAELQAARAFLWAADKFKDHVPAELTVAWIDLAAQEKKHMNWLLERMRTLGVAVRERAVSDALYHALIQKKSAREFAHGMAEAETRGARAGLRFYDAMREFDFETATVFHQIAVEERAHIELAYRFFPL